VGAVIVVDLPHTGADAPHLDTRVLVLGEREIAAARGLVQAAPGMAARFFVFLRDTEGAGERSPGDDLRFAPKVQLSRAQGLEDALDRAGVRAKVRWIPAAAPWEVDGAGGAEWIALQQSLWAHALNLLTIAEGVLVGLDRHAAFYRAELGAECVDAEREVLDGAFAHLSCCALIEALRKRGKGKPVIVTLRGDEISRARGGARSLVMPLVREREEG
jgi:arginine deiminase